MSVRVAIQTPALALVGKHAVKTFADLASAAVQIGEVCRICGAASVWVRVERADDWPDAAAATAELARLLAGTEMQA